MRPALRHPPAFSVELKPDPLWRMLACLLSGLAAMGLAATLLQHLTPWLESGWLVGSLPIAGTLGALAARWTARDYRYRLRWDGQVWWLSMETQQESQISLSTAADLDGWLLLRIQRAGLGASWRPLYLPLGESAAQPHWLDLRATLFLAAQA